MLYLRKQTNKTMTRKEKDRQMRLLAKIREARKAKGYSQTFVGKKLGLSQEQYSLFETGKTQVPLERFLIISEILELNFDLMPSEEEQEKKYFEKFLSFVQNVYQNNSNANTQIG